MRLTIIYLDHLGGYYNLIVNEHRMASLQYLTALTLLALLLVQTLNTRTGNVSTTLMDHYDDGSEMNQRIILDYMSSEQCQSWCDRYSRDELLNAFEHFREDWV